ncbi:tetratricopeptide repeat protein [Allopontixanthobacter sp.]|uniref:tetratricopeptide repeat protein n=1 Tax=Allopontixanthobacter sp. TaxID=2906452 RepID=UPI002ABC8B5F|nr:tetratricopeptide repeat protein [Allopontixanthobacter sp.]MDZ4306944.1 tetratricopeptide repeat protein [Allopontixanthobacter sp.]
MSAMDPEARKYFDQGLAFAYGFNHLAAIRSFRRAREIEPACAECWWGEAMANGPNINSAMSGEQNQAALEALAQARRLSSEASPFAKELIAAQSARYSNAANADRAQLDRAYAQAMLEIAARHPASDDLAVLAAEAAMNTSPWNYWTENGSAMPLISEAVGLIEKVMARNPAHPQASHLYIHLLELPEPKKAEAAADRLRASGPKALAHLVHMPAHIYYRLGRYEDSLQANIEAVAADEAYLREVGDDGLVRFGYYPHNVHFLLTSAQAMGDVATIVNQTAKLESILDVETGKELYWVQSIYAAPYFAYAQYASPQATLALTSTAHPLGYVEAMRHYARAVALSAESNGKPFDAEVAAMGRLIESADVKQMEANGFPAPLIIRLAGEVAKGRRALALSRTAEAIRHFTNAAEMQKEIPYNEPPFWYYPVSQSLGAAYFKAGRYEDARQAFKAALFAAPNSALALYGLARTERKLGNRRETQAAEQAFEAVWKGDNSWLDMSRI